MFAEKYYPDNKKDEGPSVAEIIEEHLTRMTSTMTESVTTKTILDVESKVSENVIICSTVSTFTVVSRYYELCLLRYYYNILEFAESLNLY